MLIDISYFTKGTRHIYNATTDPQPLANGYEVNEAIEDYICEFQERFLTGILGEKYGNKANAYLVCLDEDESYKHNDTFDSIFEQIRESFAYFVFYQILRHSNTQSTISGLVMLKCANDYTSPIKRQVSAWNRMVELNSAFVQWSQSADCPLSDITTSTNLLTKINILNL